MVTCPKCRSNDNRVYKDIRNSVIYTMYICNRCICSTLLWNKTYHTKGWIRNDDNVWLIEPRDKLYQSVEKLVLLLARSGKLFYIKDIITDET